MSRRYRPSNQVSRTASRAEARANRKLQLIVSNSHPGGQGKTLMEKAEDLLDAVLIERRTKAQNVDQELSDEEQDEYLDWMLKNEGEIRGMLKQVALWRSTSVKVELDRAKIRIEGK